MTNTICKNPLSVHTVQQKVVVSGKNEQYDVDLAGLSTWMNENDRNRYLLIVIDVFSLYLWVEPLKSKTGSEVQKKITKNI